MRVPDAAGLKTTLAVQFAPATRVEPQVVEESTKSAALVPAIATLLMETVELCALVSITDCAALVDPTAVLANERLPGLGVRLFAATPRPVRATVCGLLVPVSVNCSVADRFPVVVGAKTIVAVQLPDAARVVPQVLAEITKSPGLVPPTAMLLMVIELVPLLVSVTDFGPPLPPTATKVQFNAVGDTVADEVPPDPVPVRLTDCGLLVALSVNCNAAVRVPGAVGLKTTVAEQAPPATRLEPQVVPLSTKSAALVPLTATLLIVTAVLRVLVTVTDCAALLDPTAVLANDRLPGLTLTPFAAVPSPVNATACGLLSAVSVNCSVADRLPVVVGAKTMEAVQLAEAASEVPQVFDQIRKSPGLLPPTTILLMVIEVAPVLVSVIDF